MTAGPVVDQLAAHYQSQDLPVVFVEQGTSNPLGNRYSRFWQAHRGGTAYYPLVIIDSGHRYTQGPRDYYNDWKAMIDEELARPAQAQFEVYGRRNGDAYWASGRLTNLSGDTLSSGNNAAITLLVYEEARVGVTGRYVRAAPNQAIVAPLSPGASVDFTLQTGQLSGVNWDKVHALVLADYLPQGYSGAYDMLQAATPVPLSGIVSPASLRFMVDPARPDGAEQQLTIDAPPGVIWNATEAASWLSLAPASGQGPGGLTATVDPIQLAAGWQQAEISLALTTPSGLDLGITNVPVQAFYGHLDRCFVPLLSR